MPELPDIELYRVRLEERILGETLESIRIPSPFVLRSFATAPSELEKRKVVAVERLGKRIVLALEGEFFVVIHLMISGRLQWQSGPAVAATGRSKDLLVIFQFSSGRLTLLESTSRKRASIHLVGGRSGLLEHRRNGIDVAASDTEEFSFRLREKNRTLKRALTDPHSFDGIGNAFSDEILFHAKLSPMRLTGSLTDTEVETLHSASRDTLRDWTERLQQQVKGFPKSADVTAFRPDYAVHGRFGKPCLVCGSPIQHIVYSENETNYCSKCQNEGRLLADRSLSRLLKSDWPKTLEEMDGN